MTGTPAASRYLDNNGYGDEWQYIGEATGDVAVPVNVPLQLVINGTESKDLSGLSKLRPDDLDMLIIDYSLKPVRDPDMTIMPYLSGLTGLKTLHLFTTGITHNGLRHIKGFKSLRELRLGVKPRFGDAVLADMSELSSLEVLIFAGAPADSSLSHLAKLTSLRELRIDVSNIKGSGLVNLEGLPSLQYLILKGKSFGDDGLAYITNLKSLRRLKLWGSELQITNAGLAHLSKLTDLEELDFIWINRITDGGLVHLKPLHSLKKVDFQMSPITDKGLAHLADLKSLESIEGVSLTDEGMTHLGQFKNLKCLDIRSGADSPITDPALQNLTELQFLEELTIGELGIGGKGITDAGMSYIARLTNLKKLHLNTVLVTNAGLAKLAALKSLEDLLLRTPKATASGLSRLNALPNLISLYIYSFAKDKSALDISGLTKLRKLDFAYYCPIGDKDLASIGQLKHLRRLHINSSRTITDAGMVHLAGLTSLTWLSIYGDHDLTDESLSYLSGMKGLTRLSICGHFTDEGLTRLEQLKTLRDINISCDRPFSGIALLHLRKELPNLLTLRINTGQTSTPGSDRRDSRQPRSYQRTRRRRY